MAGKRLRILHLEDNPNDASLIQAILESDGIEADTVLVDKADEFIKVLDKGEIDLILSDYTLPTFDGITALKIAQTMRPEIPFIFVSGTIGEERAIDAVRRGATDYVVKERLMHITSVIRRALREREDHQKRIEAEKQLKESEERFRALVENSSDGIALVSAEGNILYTGPSTSRVIGYTKEEFEGRNVLDFIHPNDRHRTMVFLGELVQQPGKAITTQYRFKHKDGVWKWMEATGNNVLNITAIQAIVLNYRDITERKDSEEKLAQSEENYRSLFESARDAIFTLATDGTITALNTAFERITGWKRVDWLGKTFSDILHPDDRRLALELFKRVLHGEAPPIHEFRMRTKSRGYLVGEFVTTPQIREGKLVGVLGVARDITERKKLEEEVKHAQKMESIGTLAGGIAHDFNNILGILLGYISILRGGKLDVHQMPETFMTMETAVQRGAQLVKQILTFARRSETLMEPVSVNSVVEELSKMIHETFPRAVNLLKELDSSLLSIEGDANQIHQALLNLCVNARDAMPKGGDLSMKTSKISGTQLQKRFADAVHEEYICITIADTGVGIDEATKTRIFEPFFTTKEAGKGTGLGLAVVFGVVKSHNGFVDVESQVGHGTVFSLYFPVPSKIAQSGVEEKDELQAVPGGKESILIVEDELALQELLKTFLEEKGYTVFTASNGLEEIDVFARNKDKICLLFSDLGLPKLSGLDAYDRIKGMKPGIKTILASGFIEPFERSEISKMGVSEFLQKPYDPVQILRKIREVLDAP